MFKRLFGKSEREKEEERLRRELEEEKARREQTIAENRNLLKAALRNLQKTVDGVPTEAAVKECTDQMQQAISALDKEKAGQELTQQDRALLDKLRAYAQGVKVDKRRYEATFTPEKQEQLKDLELRHAVSEDIAKATKSVTEARQKQKAFRVGERLNDACKAALANKNVAQAAKALDGMTKAYEKSGFTRAAAISADFQKEIRRVAAAKLERVWRGHEGRKTFRDVSWNSDKYRIEATSLFVALDETRDGSLSISELKIGLARAGYSRADVLHIIKVMDEDGSGEVDREEFIENFRKALTTKKASSKLLLPNSSEIQGEAPNPNAPPAKPGDLCTGDKVWYRRQDGSRSEALVVSVDYGKQPLSYVVKVEGRERETGRERLEEGAWGPARPGTREAWAQGAGDGQDSMERVMDEIQLGTTVYADDGNGEGEGEGELDIPNRVRVFLEEEESKWVADGAQIQLPGDGGGSMAADSTGATEHVFGELHFAAKKGDVIRVWALVNKAKVPVDSLTSSGSAALHFAGWEGQAGVLSVLVALGADVNRRTAAGYTPLHCAASNNRFVCIQELSRLRADLDRPAARSLSTPLHCAARNGHLESVEMLCEVKATVDALDWGQNTPLMYAARHGRVSVVQRLVELKANLRADNADGKTALFHAAESGHIPACAKLIELGVGATDVLLYGGTAADFADSRGHSDCASFLRSKEPARGRGQKGRRSSMFGIGIGKLDAAMLNQ